MAVNPGGYGEHRSAQVRRVLYISIIVIVVVVVAIAGFILKRSRGGSQEVTPEPQANTTEQGQPGGTECSGAGCDGCQRLGCIGSDCAGDGAAESADA